MRHFLLSGTITALAPGMGEPALATALVTPAGGLSGGSPGLCRTDSATVDLATITGAADDHLSAAALAEIQAGGRVHRLPRLERRRTLDAILQKKDTAHASPCPARWGVWHWKRLSDRGQCRARFLRQTRFLPHCRLSGHLNPVPASTLPLPSVDLSRNFRFLTGTGASGVLVPGANIPW